jgi:hypothetical protein
MSVTSPLARAFLDALHTDPPAITELRALLRIDQPRPVPAADGWLDTKAAARYLGLTIHGVHKLTAGRLIPFEQDGPGCRCWFKPAELDAWREKGGAGGYTPAARSVHVSVSGARSARPVPATAPLPPRPERVSSRVRLPYELPGCAPRVTSRASPPPTDSDTRRAGDPQR